MSGGRPPKLTADVQKRLCDAIAAANTYVAACAHAGISYRAFATWMRRGKTSKSGRFVQFVQAVRSAEARAELSLVTQLRQIVLEERDWHGILALLGRRFPGRWADRSKQDLKLSGKAQVDVAIQEVVISDRTEADRYFASLPGAAELPG